jgi:predicted RNA binding protein YcfA (HicA-like mRNA interferase family)
MATLHNLKPERVIKAFERVGWINKGTRGSHVKLIKTGSPNILSIPVHKGSYPLLLTMMKEKTVAT